MSKPIQIHISHAGKPSQKLPEQLTDEDRLWGAICRLQFFGAWPLGSIAVLLQPKIRSRAFVRHHMVLSLVTGLANTILVMLFGYLLLFGSATRLLLTGITPNSLDLVMFGGGLCLAAGIFFLWPGLLLWWAYRAYKGNLITIPVLSNIAQRFIAQ